MPNSFAIPLDNGDGGLLADMTDELQRMGLRHAGSFRRPIDGREMLVIETTDRDTIAAEIMARRVMTHYNPRRIAA